MKTSQLVIVILMIAIMLFILVPSLVPSVALTADDGATLYNAKCAACHGVDGAGKPAAKIPSLISDEARKATDADLTDGVANGGPGKRATHAFQAKGVTPDQIKMILSYIREMQKK